MGKIIESLKINDYEILTDTGWEDIEFIHKTKEYDIWKIRTDSFELECADDHIVFSEDYEEIYVKDLYLGDIIMTKNGVETLYEIKKTDVSENMFDLELSKNSNKRYYTNGILSHNTTLAKILLKGTDDLVLNCSSKEERGIDVISEIVLDHCTKFNFGKKGQKIVFLEEFDNATPDMRKALRSFIEDYSDNVRFIACVNNINKLKRTEEDRALLGRFNLINFDPETKEEVDYLKKYQQLYLKSICKSIKLEVDEKVLDKLINRSFPNFRATIQLLQELYISGDFESFMEMKESQNKDVFDFIMNGENNLTENYYYVMENYMSSPEDLLLILGRPLFKYLMDNRNDLILSKGGLFIKLGKEYNQFFASTSDPVIHVYYYLSELKELINNI